MKELMYKIWCFFMDSKEGERKYHEACHKYWLERNRGIVVTLITFPPYPGRLHWREWWIVERYRNWRFNFPKNQYSIIGDN